MSFIARVISDGRITIPREVRELLSLEDDAFVICHIQPQFDGPRRDESASRMLPQLHRIRSILAACAQGADQEELARGMGLSKARLTGYIDFLVAERLLRARRDGRREILEATPEGLELVERLRG